MKNITTSQSSNLIITKDCLMSYNEKEIQKLLDSFWKDNEFGLYQKEKMIIYLNIGIESLSEIIKTNLVTCSKQHCQLCPFIYYASKKFGAFTCSKQPIYNQFCTINIDDINFKTKIQLLLNRIIDYKEKFILKNV